MQNMSKRNWFVLVLVFTSVFSHNFSVFGSSVQGRTFKRPDPLDHLRPYRGGYDVTNIHYWTSAAYTGIHGYAFGGVWILCGMAYGCYMIFKCSFGNSSSTVDYSDSSFLIMLLLVLLFSFLAIVATGLAIAADQRCLYRTRRLKNTAFGIATEARKNIKNVTQAMNEMQTLLLPYDKKTTRLLNVTSRQLGAESRIIRAFVRDFERTIDKVIQIIYTVNLVLVTVSLGFLIVGTVLLISHWRTGFIVILLFCWMLATLCWFLTGFDFVIHTFAKDTCSALEDYKQNPQNNSLSSILPCEDPSYSDNVLAEIGHIVHISINELNSKVSELTELIRSKEDNENPNYVVGTLCNPFSGAPNYSYTPEKCPKEAMQIGDLGGVLSKFTCYQTTVGDCAREGRFIPEAAYFMALAYSNTIDELIKIFPDLKSLLQCSFVKDSLTNIVLHQCKPYKASTRKLWLSMLCLSVFTVVLVLLLVAKAYQDKGRTWSHCSVFPIR